MFNDPLRLGMTCSTVIVLALIALRMVQLGKAPRVTIGEKGATISAGESAPPVVAECPLSEKHIPMLDKLTAMADAALVEAKATRRVLYAHGIGLDVLLAKAAGEQLNGEIDQARKEIIRAEGYRQGTAEAVGAEG